MSMRIIFVRALRIVLLMSVFAFASCQEAGYDFYSAIAGAVYDSSTGEPLENASIVLNPTNMTLQTGQDGSFIFDSLDAGQYTLSVQKEGYRVDRKTVTAISGETVTTDILLRKI